MKMNHIAWLSAFLLMLFSQFAQAKACSIIAVTSPGISATYNSGIQATNVTSTTVTVTCTKSGTDAQVYTVEPDNGQNFNVTNRASYAGNFINYFLSTSSTCANPWSANNPLTFTFTTTGTQTQTVYGCIPANQYNAPASTIPYIDNVVMTVFRKAKKVKSSIVIPGSFQVSIATQGYCNISTAPGNVAFNYTAFQNAASLANTTFGMTCNKNLPYTMSLDTAGGVVSGLNYSLGINATANSGGTVSHPGTGNGNIPQTFYINGSMPANQAGTCNTGSCTGSQLHTLTVTY